MIHRIFAKISTFVKDYWNFYSSIIISSIASWLNDWNAVQLQAINQFLSVTISLICLFTLLKFFSKPKYKRTPIETLFTMQKPVKNMSTAVDPESKIEQNVVLISNSLKGGRKIMEKFKAFVKWFWGNKMTLASTCFTLALIAYQNILVFTDKLLDIEFIALHNKEVRIVSVILSIIYVGVDMFTTYTKYGLESSEELEARKQLELELKMSKLTKEQRSAIKEQIEKLELQLNPIAEKYNEVATFIANFKLLMSVDETLLDEEARAKYKEAIALEPVLQGNMQKIKVTINSLNDKLR